MDDKPLDIKLERIAFYEDGPGLADDGDYVHYDEAMAIISRLQAEVDALQAEIDRRDEEDEDIAMDRHFENF